MTVLHRLSLLGAALALVGCAGRPPLSGVGEASPPGLHRNANPAAVVAVEAPDALDPDTPATLVLFMAT